MVLFQSDTKWFVVECMVGMKTGIWTIRFLSLLILNVTSCIS